MFSCVAYFGQEPNTESIRTCLHCLFVYIFLCIFIPVLHILVRRLTQSPFGLGHLFHSANAKSSSHFGKYIVCLSRYIFYENYVFKCVCQVGPVSQADIWMEWRNWISTNCTCNHSEDSNSAKIEIFAKCLKSEH